MEVLGKASLTDSCVCENEDGEPIQVCAGDCHEWQIEDVESLVAEWLDLNGTEPDGDFDTFVNYSGVNWTRNSGAGRLIEFEGTKVWKRFTLDGDFTLEFTLNSDGTLEVVRRSHDELGAFFSLSIVKRVYLKCGGCGLMFNQVTEAEDFKAHACE